MSLKIRKKPKPPSIAVVFLGLLLSFALAKDQRVVAFNTKSLKYHFTSCQWARKCTVNCIEVPLPEAVASGGVPCKVCKPPRW